MTFLGVDIGTSAVKVVALDENGATVGEASASLNISRPQRSWSEQNPEDWVCALDKAVIALPAKLRASVGAIGLAGQMHGAVILDASDKPIRPAILWNDGRSARECLLLEQKEPASREITGNLAMPGFTAPKLIWLERREPDAFARIRTVLLPKDYVRFAISGEKASDLSDASGTLWVDVNARTWSEAMIEASGLSLSAMPRLMEGVEETGALSAEVASRWGMPRARLFAGASDNAAGAVGAGVVNDGEAMLSLGTSGVIFVANNLFRPNPARAVHAFCHCLPNRWHQMSVILNAASCLDWTAKLLNVESPGHLVALAERRGAIGGEEIFLPYLCGERTPHNDPNARGVFFGMSQDTDAAALAEAVLEGVAFALAEGLNALKEADANVTSLSVIGGGAQSRWWGGILAAALETPLTYRESASVGPAFGAARIAMIGATGAPPQTIATPPAVIDEIAPAPEDVERLTRNRTRFTNLYAALRGAFTSEE